MFKESIGGTARVADRMGCFVRKESLGTSRSRSADLVSSLRRLGALGRRGELGFRNPTAEGGGEGVAADVFRARKESGLSVLCEEEVALLAGIIGSGEGGLVDVVDEGSISGSFLDRRAALVSSWKRPSDTLRFIRVSPVAG
jgi:hypothetical protein